MKMPLVKNEPRPPEYDALSMQHCYFNTPPERPLPEASVQYWWLPHLANEQGEYTAPSGNPAFAYSLTFGQLVDRTIEPEGLPKLKVADLIQYIRQLGAETLVEYETKTGVFAPPPPPPETKPTTETETVTEGVK